MVRPAVRPVVRPVKLLIDIGNTSLKWALRNGPQLGPMTAARHFGALPIDVIASWEQIAAVDQILVSSVGPDAVLDAVTAAAAAYWGCALTRVRTQARAHGVTIAYAEPSRLGVDRFLGLVAAHALEGSPTDPGSAGPTAVEPRAPTLIVDAGTAITFDGLLADGVHLGGQILPGITTMRSSLLQDTQLPSHHTHDHSDVWAQDTGPAIAGASLQAPVALAERLMRQLEQRTGNPARLVLTGGDAERLAPFLPAAEHHPDLVLQGLARFA